MRIIEAALFSAGTPLSSEELKELTDLTESKIKSTLKLLIDEYNQRESALEIAQVGEKYSMQLKTEYAPHVQKFAPMEIPVKVLKTAALIAYHQPIRQRDLFDMVGYKVYEHAKILHELGLIRRRESGRTKIITTTERFSEYFGIASTDREEIKKWLMEKVNPNLAKGDMQTIKTDEQNKVESTEHIVENEKVEKPEAESE